DLPDRDALAGALGIALPSPLVVVTVHPATLDADPAAAARAVAAAMDAVPATYVITLPNVDPGSAEVASLMEAAGRSDGRVTVGALGERRYWGLLRIADAVLGNSSSGVMEAPATGVPVVNVGDRQAGRRRDGLVLDAPADAAAVTAALRSALEPATHDAARAARPRLADGRAGERAARMIAAWHPARPPRKAPLAVDR
ncbi:MAG TPA: UDP-N-acetylglucosamine 2-epimerase, partial [Candidatus Limnocylindrales bacterium]|nr:UDP-N-acetylglucosamine 2-epimerase [Candidatus Limnocylindrales bacterium]